MSEKADFIKFLKGDLGAKPDKPDKKHLRWLIGAKPFNIPNNLSGYRAFLNYVRAAKGIAVQQGLLPEEPERTPPRPKKRRRAKSTSGRVVSPDGEEATPDEIRAWMLINEFERRESQRRFLEGARMEGPMVRVFVRFEERVDKIKAVITEAGKPLNHEEIYRAVGWSGSYDKEAARRTLNKAVPEHFRVVPTERKRYPKFDLASNVLQPLGLEKAGTVEAAIETARAAEAKADRAIDAFKPAPTSSATEFPAGQAAAEEDAAYLGALLEEIGKTAEGARSSDAERAFFTLGKIAGLVEGWQRSASKPAR